MGNGSGNGGGWQGGRGGVRGKWKGGFWDCGTHASLVSRYTGASAAAVVD